MKFYGLTNLLTATMSEMWYLAGVNVDDTLPGWDISMWRHPMELANVFLVVGYLHLPQVSPVTFRIKEVPANGLVIVLTARFTNLFDAYFLLGKVF
ncbi:hypothetical protein D1007_44842 [Hordeum vulgare]|nr:hypothetical protein D1007_44842 [Hordeum vulgare]